MIVLNRLMRVVLATVLCIVLFAALFELLNAASRFVFTKEGLGDAERFWRIESIFGALWWGVIFRSPGLVFFGTVPFAIIFMLLEWRSVRSRWAYLGIWMGASLFSFGGSLFAALLSGGAAGYLYWLLAGRTAGKWDAARRSQSWMRFMLLNYVAYAVLAYLAFQLVGYAHYGGKLYWVTHVAEPEMGTPPFRTLRKGELIAAKKVALMDFPDPASCLERDVRVLSRESLKRMDWDKINNDAEAEVCTFRLLGSYEDMSHATDWLKAQGVPGFGGLQQCTAARASRRHAKRPRLLAHTRAWTEIPDARRHSPSVQVHPLRHERLYEMVGRR